HHRRGPTRTRADRPRAAGVGCGRDPAHVGSLDLGHGAPGTLPPRCAQLRENPMESTRKLWYSLAALLIVSFSVLLWAGTEIFRAAPPVPEQVVADNGAVVFTRADIEKGRQVWQSMGGMQLGPIWGHGGYGAPDWRGDCLDREAVHLLGLWARADGGMATWDLLPDEEKEALRGRLKREMRPNTYDAATGTITL